MAATPCDLFQTHSAGKLAEMVAQCVATDHRSLPSRAKTFAAVAKIQGFDAFPEMRTPEAIDALIAAGGIELNRGLSGSNGIPAILYARELVMGRLYPGTQSAFGTGIYLSDMGCAYAPASKPVGFVRIARTSYDHARGGENGVIMRCVIKTGAKILSHDDLKEIRRENKNRFREAQLSDCGSLAAALGCDGFKCDGIEPNHGEQWYVIVNRSALIFQNTCVSHTQVPPPP
jgi:hypothetical protein